MMTEFRALLRPALADKHPIRRNGVSLEALPEGTLLHLLAPVAKSDAAALSECASSAGLALRPTAPGQWFAVGDKALPHADLKAFEAKLSPLADVVDQSHGRVRILLTGLMATRVLAKGTAVDLSLGAFPVGHSATTLIGHIAAHVTRVGEHAFELIVLRGFSESLWDDLSRMSLEFS